MESDTISSTIIFTAYPLVTLAMAAVLFLPKYDKKPNSKEMKVFWVLYPLIVVLILRVIQSIVWSLIFNGGAKHISSLYAISFLVPITSLSFSFLSLFCEYNTESGRLKVSDAVYFSIVTFTTLGYGDIAPRDGKAKLVAATLGLFSYIYVPLMFAVVTSFRY